MQAGCGKIEVFVVSTNWPIKVNVIGQTVLLLYVLKSGTQLNGPTIESGCLWGGKRERSYRREKSQKGILSIGKFPLLEFQNHSETIFHQKNPEKQCFYVVTLVVFLFPLNISNVFKNTNPVTNANFLPL